MNVLSADGESDLLSSPCEKYAESRCRVSALFLTTISRPSIGLISRTNCRICISSRESGRTAVEASFKICVANLLGSPDNDDENTLLYKTLTFLARWNSR